MNTKLTYRDCLLSIQQAIDIHREQYNKDPDRIFMNECLFKILQDGRNNFLFYKHDEYDKNKIKVIYGIPFEVYINGEDFPEFYFGQQQFIKKFYNDCASIVTKENN